MSTGQLPAEWKTGTVSPSYKSGIACDVSKYRPNPQSITVAYVDYSKVLDVVCHSKLIYKLQHCGISDDLLKWINSFVSGGTQRTKIGSAISDQVSLSSGVV